MPSPMSRIFGKKSALWAFYYALLLSLAVLPKTWKLDSPDFKVFYTAAQHALHDAENIYRLSPDRYLYPPSTSIILVPFAFTRHWHFHQLIWHALLACLIFLLARRSYAAFFACALLTRYFLVNLSYGQINLWVLFLLWITQQWLDQGKERRAGALWAVVASIKVYPLVLGLEFVLRKKWRGILVFLASCLGLLLLPFLLFGHDLGSSLYKEFFAALASKGLPLHSHNQSFAALFSRLFTQEYFDIHGVGTIRWGFFPFGATAARVLAWLVGISLSIVAWRQSHKEGTGYLSAAAFSILFLSHIVWKDYLLFLYFPLAELLAKEYIPLQRRIWGASLFAALVTLSSPAMVGARNAALFDAASIHLWGAVLVWIVWINYLSPCSLLPVTKRP